MADNTLELKIRKGAPSVQLTREEFRARFRAQFVDPAFDKVDDQLSAVEEVAWDGYANHRKAPRTQKAGPGYADPDYDLSVDWIAARDAIAEAKKLHDSSEQIRVIVVIGSARSEHTCPGERSKTSRLATEAAEYLREQNCHVDTLDLSNLTSEYGRKIHPCKACVSTAMPLCHYPCSCYPNYSLGQTQDWMNELYPRFTAAHAVVIITPVYWYQATSALKLLLDRLVCADGGNTDPTSTKGKDPAKAKAIELAGWDFPKHLAGRTFSLIVHGDYAGADTARRLLHDTLVDMDLEPAGVQGELDRQIGYLEPYATSHDAMDKDEDLITEVKNAMKVLVARTTQLRAGVARESEGVHEPRPK